MILGNGACVPWCSWQCNSQIVQKYDLLAEGLPIMDDGRKRVSIRNVQPQIDGGLFPIKRVVDETVSVTADILADGHDVLVARLLYKGPGDTSWKENIMRQRGNDSWGGEFSVHLVGYYEYTVMAWVDAFATWQVELRKRVEAGQDVHVHLLVGADLIRNAIGRAPASEGSYLEKLSKLLAAPSGDVRTRLENAQSQELSEVMIRYSDRSLASTSEKALRVVVERPKALFSTWYERFPRSCSPVPGRHGTFADCTALLPEIARMGFDVLYLPPIHPIGEKNRKGKNNETVSKPNDVGSPWAIGSEEGGHLSVHPQLGTIKDLQALLHEAKKLGIEVAMDIALQCAPDHPYVRKHPQWFKWLPDGSVQHAENPPKKYEDIIPFNFETEEWEGLWNELKGVVLFWAGQGVRIFRVDNPHTKPFPFWEWLIRESKEQYPDLIYLSEAFTRPKVMYELAKVGFTQSYTYFTWRNTKPEFIDYITHLLNTEVREFFRPNFWPNTPDILPEHLQFGGRPAFVMRLLLAATLSSNYGIYGPAFELCENEAIPGKEEYLNSEKYEIKLWDWNKPGNLKDLIARVNTIRKENVALQTTWNLHFYEVDNEYLIFYGKANQDRSNIILVVINLDPAHVQSGWVKVPLRELDIPEDQPYLVHELLSDDKYIWHGERNYVELDPKVSPGHIFRVRKRLKRETDFDYYF
jgi:starch synthase (maltosyl-transferring)